MAVRHGHDLGGARRSDQLLRGRAGAALFLDCRTQEAELVPLPVARHGLAVLVVDTKVAHSHADGGYAARRASCERGAAALVNGRQIALFRTFDGRLYATDQIDPFSGAAFVFRSKRADRIKLLVWDRTGMVLVHKRLEGGKFVWPQATDGAIALSPAQLSMLLEGIDWRRPLRSAPIRAV